MEKTSVIAAVCDALGRDDLDGARDRLRSDYPHDGRAITPRRYGPAEASRVFVRDGFIDRYAGTRLLFPPVLRVISLALPDVFPYHANWKSDETHPAYWALTATVDHLIPVARGGTDEESNWVTTSMLRNSAKANALLEEMDWVLHPCGDLREWDGMMAWFLSYTGQRPELLKHGAVRVWHRAAKQTL